MCHERDQRQRFGTRAAPLMLTGMVLLLLVSCTPRPAPPSDRIPSGWPVAHDEAHISSRFGARRSGGSSHQGIDLSAPRGTEVRATAAGVVTFAGRSRGPYGRMVTISHGNGYETLYAHLRRVEVRRGERVRRGQQVGSVGSSGNASGFHLHYEVRQYGRPVDPQPFLGP